MSLNRCEQQLFDYVQRNPEERHYWEQKVRGVAGREAVHDASVILDGYLWSYLMERAQVVAEFKEHAKPGAKRVSLRNLAEYLLRLWVAPKPAPARKPSH